MNCWRNYENELKKIQLSWKQGAPLTTPTKKTMIYAYLEVLLGSSKSQKELIKEVNRDYTNTNHWNLNAEALKNLIEFLRNNLSE